MRGVAASVRRRFSRPFGRFDRGRLQAVEVGELHLTVGETTEELACASEDNVPVVVTPGPVGARGDFGRRVTRRVSG